MQSLRLSIDFSSEFVACSCIVGACRPHMRNNHCRRADTFTISHTNKRIPHQPIVENMTDLIAATFFVLSKEA
jgi:hypothetical protein